MNKTYRNVWNATTRTWTAVAETASARRKGAACRAGAVLLLLSGLAVPAFAADACDQDDESDACRRVSIIQTGAIDSLGRSASLFAVTNPAAASEGSTAAGNATGNPVAGGNAASALGSGARAGGNGSVAVGALAQAGGSSSVAVGVAARANGGIGLIAIGDYASALGNPSADLPMSRYQNGAGNVALGSSASVDVATNTDASGASVSIGAMSYTNREGVVSVGSSAAGTSFNRQIVNVGAGTQASDAVNVSQLEPVVDALGGGAAFNSATGAVTGPTYNLANGGTQMTVGSALGALDDALTTAKSDIAQNASDISGLGTQMTTLDSRVTANETNIARNVSDIARLDTQMTTLDGRVTANETHIAQNTADITTINAQLGDLSDGTIGLVRQASAGADLTVGANTDGDAVHFAGTAGERKLTGVANGEIAAGSTDAVTGDQLHATNQDIARNAADIAGLGTQMTHLDSRVTTNETHIAQNAADITTINAQLGDMAGGEIGLVRQPDAGADLTVGANTDGGAVHFAGMAGERKLTGVANGDIATGSTDAVTGDQLHATNQDVAQNAADIAGLGTQVTALDTRTTTNETHIAKNTTDITTINGQLDALSSGTIGLVQQAAAGADLTVGANTDGAAVNFAGLANERKLTGVANGDIAAGSTDAVTGDQLHATNQAVARNTSDIAGNRVEIANLGNKLESGQFGLVQQDPATGTITVAANGGGGAVDFAGAGGATRTLSGVSNGVKDTDAVTIAQLRATGLIDYTGKEIAAVTYDDISLGGITLGGVNGTMLRNVAPGMIAARSMDAVNGGQLHALQQDFESRFAGLDDRVAGLESGGVPGDPGNGAGGFDPGGAGEGSAQLGVGAAASGSNSTAIGAGANASSGGGTAIGSGSAASGDGSTAIGQGANASGDNAVALGAGSVADRDNAVSVGSAGNERQITNVAAGTAPTDAVNVQQLNDNINSVRSQIDSNRRDSNGGTASAVAIANLPQAALPGESMVSIAGGTYGGESAAAFGMSTATRNGKWIVKASGSTNTRGTVAVGAGVGYRW